MVAPWIHDHQPKRVRETPLAVAEPEPVHEVAVATVQLDITPPPIVKEKEEVIEVIEESVDLSKLLKAHLIILAQERGLDTSGCTKARLIELLKV